MFIVASWTWPGAKQCTRGPGLVLPPLLFWAQGRGSPRISQEFRIPYTFSGYVLRGHHPRSIPIPIKQPGYVFKSLQEKPGRGWRKQVEEREKAKQECDLRCSLSLIPGELLGVSGSSELSDREAEFCTSVWGPWFSDWARGHQ